MTSETPRRWPTARARAALAGRFGLPYSTDMQDWEWEAADPARFDEFLGAYSPQTLDDDERFSLMEILIQCVNDADVPAVEPSPQWRCVASLLHRYPALHADSIRYWACLDDDNLDDCFRVSAPMRAVWQHIRP